MSERKSKFFGLVVFLVLVIGFTYLMITGSKTNQKEVYNHIVVTENSLLPANEYLRFARLNDSTKYSDLTLLQVKSKIEKHPYLRKAEVEFDGVSTILVEVQEKEIKAVLLQKNVLKLITSDSETLPLFPPTSIEDIPVISKINYNNKNTFNNDDVEFAFRIIDAITLSDTNVSNNLAEINLQKNGDVILTFTGLGFPVLFGKNDEAKKALIIKNLWYDMEKYDNSYEAVDYIDLRYKNKVFIGKRKTELASK